jgi:hypothetical protein
VASNHKVLVNYKRNPYKYKYKHQSKNSTPKSVNNKYIKCVQQLHNFTKIYTYPRGDRKYTCGKSKIVTGLNERPMFCCCLKANKKHNFAKTKRRNRQAYTRAQRKLQKNRRRRRLRERRTDNDDTQIKRIIREKHSIYSQIGEMRKHLNTTIPWFRSTCDVQSMDLIRHILAYCKRK